MCKDFVYRVCFRKNTTIKYFTALLVIIFCALSTAALAADDAYLKALEIEAEKSAHVEDNNEKIKQDEPVFVLDKNELLKFESVLKSSRPATYRFYKKLNEQDKTIIFSLYKEDNKLTRASKTVLDLYFNKKY